MSKLKRNPYTEAFPLFHGTSRSGAASIIKNGIKIDKTAGGYFGWAFYITPDADLAWANYADFAEDDERGAVLEFELVDGSGVLDLRRAADNDVWGPWSRRINDRNMYKAATKAGITGVYDRSNDAIAVYDPKILRLVAVHMIEEMGKKL